MVAVLGATGKGIRRSRARDVCLGAQGMEAESLSP